MQKSVRITPRLVTNNGEFIKQCKTIKTFLLSYSLYILMEDECYMRAAASIQKECRSGTWPHSSAASGRAFYPAGRWFNSASWVDRCQWGLSPQMTAVISSLNLKKVPIDLTWSNKFFSSRTIVNYWVDQKAGIWSLSNEFPQIISSLNIDQYLKNKQCLQTF